MTTPDRPSGGLSAHIRRWHCTAEEIWAEGGRILATPLKRVIVAAVVTNPCAGVYRDNLDELIDLGEQLSLVMTGRAQSLLGAPVVAYGKAGIVGTNGEIEHVAAILHPKFGQPLRKAVNGHAILQSTKKRSGPGATIDIPLSHITDMKVRSHMDSTTFFVPDAPLPDELVVCLAVSAGERPEQRIGGLTESDASSRRMGDPGA